ncbi:hypothetical protein BC827DRAFT_1269315 [Russula dissimulans]|nr:hypothetical protein BC827DRAFT_1269315 [Russula dissimulans]
MTTLHDSPQPVPTTLYTPAVINFWHVMSGLYFWEFFTTLELEWNVIRGRRPYIWTIWVYSLTRVATLANVILKLLDLDTKIPQSCQVLISLDYAFAYMSLAAASFLIVLRANAIWNRRKVIMSISFGVWGANTCLLVVGVSRLRSSWSPEQDHCVMTNVQTVKINAIVLLATDVVLLLITLVGLFCLGAHGTFSLGRLLWKQGIAWLLLALVAEVPPAVFLTLNMSESLSVMFQFPGLTVLTIAATRVYRSLTNSDFAPGGIATDRFRKRPPVPNVMQTPVAEIPLDQMGVTVHTHVEYYPGSQTSKNGSFTSTDGEGHHKPAELILDEDLERGIAS